LKMINSYGLQICCWKPLWRWLTAMAFKSAAENLWSDQQQLWPSNLLLKPLKWSTTMAFKSAAENLWGSATAMAFKSPAAVLLLQHYLEIKWWRRSSIPQNVQCTSLTVLFASVCF
jgi:hypothetical protein